VSGDLKDKFKGAGMYSEDFLAFLSQNQLLVDHVSRVYDAACCSVLQRVAACCSVLQSVAVI